MRTLLACTRWSVVLVDELGRRIRLGIGLGDRSLAFVDFGSRMKTENSGICLSVGWKPIEIESSGSVGDQPVERFELLVMKRS